MIDWTAYGTTGMFPVRHSAFVSPSRRSGATRSYESSRCLRATAEPMKTSVTLRTSFRSEAVRLCLGGSR